MQLQDGKLYIKKRTPQQWLTLFVLVMPFLLQTFLQLFGLPRVINYTIDVAWVVLLLMMFFKKQIEMPQNIVPFAVFVILIFVYSFIGYLFNFQSPFYFLWGVRNNFRFYIAFFAFVLYFEADDIESIFKFLNVLFWIDVAVSLIQYLILGYEQDFLGGIFGVERGSNASTLIFFSVILLNSILLFFEGKEKVLVCLSKCAAALLIAALAELKVFFVFFVVILFATMIMTRASWKKVVLSVVVVALILLSNTILIMIFESSISLDSILKQVTASSYSTQQDLGRFTAIPTISKTILTDIPARLFGLGLGNCDTSSFAVCNTPFFETHQNMHYTWFSSAFLFLETGYVGLALHFAFYIICFVGAVKMYRRKEGNRVYQQMAIIMSILCVGLVFYNSSLRTEAAYIVYFILSLPFIEAKNNVYVRHGG